MEDHPNYVDVPWRLDALRRLEIVGTPPEAAYDRLVRLATTLLDVPIAVISLVDADRSWFKARVGLDLAETHRDASFCVHTIGQEPGQALVVEDSWLDDRFEDNPLVIGSPRIRFYAGVPLRAPGGEPVGTLAVIDRTPRSLSTRELLALSDLASIVEELMASRVDVDAPESDDISAPVLLADDVEDQPVVASSIDEVTPPAETWELAADSADSADTAALRDENEAFRLLLDHTTDVIVVLDAEAQIKFASPSLQRVLGHSADFRHVDGALALVHPDDRGLARNHLTAVLAGAGRSEPFTLRVLTASGSMRNMECTAESLFSTRAIGGVVLVLRDVSERHLLSQMLAYQSTHDRLTELPNRMLFQEHLVPALARATRERRAVAVCYFDLDGFQELNDQLGYAAGDELLVDVARRVRSSIRSGDSAARLGADEFAVLLDPVASVDEAVTVARRIVAAVSGPHSLRAGVSSCGASAGVAMSVPDDDATTIIARAARGLTTSRREGDGRVVLASGPTPVAEQPF